MEKEVLITLSQVGDLPLEISVCELEESQLALVGGGNGESSLA